MLYGNRSGAQQGSSSKVISENLAHELNVSDEQLSSHVSNHDLAENEHGYNLTDNSSTFVTEQDVSSDKQCDITSKQLVQSPCKHVKVVHGTVFTASSNSGDSTSTTEGCTKGYRCLQPFGFIKKVLNITKYHLKDYSRSIIAGSNNEWVQRTLRWSWIQGKATTKVLESWLRLI